MPNNRPTFKALVAVGMLVPAIACTPARTPVSPDVPAAAPPAPESQAATGEPENWGNDGTRLFRTCQFESEAAMQAFIEELNEAADTLNHHPDLVREGTRLEIVSTTHDTGGLTNLDFELARETEQLLATRNVECQPELLSDAA